MSAPRPCCSSMRGHHGNTPLFLLLLWLLTGTWTGKVSSQDEGTEEESRTVEEVTVDQEQAVEDKETSEPTSSPPDAPPTSAPSTTREGNSDSGSTDKPEWLNSTLTPQSDEGLSITVILIPVALVVFIIVVIMFALFLKRRFNIEAAVHDSRKDDPYLDGSSTEKVPMPMFEEDVPSVLELEMEELDQWMIKDG